MLHGLQAVSFPVKNQYYKGGGEGDRDCPLSAGAESRELLSGLSFVLVIDFGVDTFKIFYDGFNRFYVAEFRFHIKHVPLDDAGNAVANGAFRHDGLEAVTRGVHDGVAYTGAGGGAHDDQRIHTEEVEGLSKVRAEEIGGVLLVDNRLFRAGLQLGIDFHPVGIDVKGAHGDRKSVV